MYKIIFLVKTFIEVKHVGKKIMIGFWGGLVTGLFASGGGMILVPCFMFFLHMKDRTSRATSAFCILPWVIISGFFYYKNNYIDWRTGIYCAIRWHDWWYDWCQIIETGSYEISSIIIYYFLRLRLYETYVQLERKRLF